MRGIDRRFPVIAVLVIVASALAFYRHEHPVHPETEPVRFFGSAPVAPDAVRIRAIIDTTAKMMGAQKKSIAFRTAADSGRIVPEASIGVPSSFDDLRLIDALADSLRPAGFSAAGAKSLKEKTTTIRISDRDHVCIFRCLLYRKELSH